MAARTRTRFGEGRGADQLTGGSGQDHFIFTSLADLTLAGDSITDYDPTSGDVIRLSALNRSDKQVGWSNGSQRLSIDVDLDGTAEYRINVLNSTLDDFERSDLNLIL